MSVKPLPGPLAAEHPRRGCAHGPTSSHQWWLWPHLLGLDAPLVALTWQDWWGRSMHESPAPGQRVVLGLGVWLIYLADRLADTARNRHGDGATARHTFARKHRSPLLRLATLVAAALVVLSPLVLPAGQFCGGLVLLAVAGVYFWLIHRGVPPRWTRHWPKEAVVGGMFALGTAFFVFCQAAPISAHLGMAVALFGAVCFANCALITAWERDRRDQRDPALFLNAFPTLANGGLSVVCWSLATIAGVAGCSWRTALFVPVAAAAAALAMLDRWRDLFNADALRCVADLVLLTPCVCLGTAVVFRWLVPFSLP